MWFLQGLVAGVLAGSGMIIASEAGYRLGIIRSHLVIVDGSFAMKLMKRNPMLLPVYIFGIFIHLFTGAVFGIVYTGLARFLYFSPHLLLIFSLYILVLWLAMLSVALPVAGQGIAGKNLGRYTWFEQFILHCVYGAVFWWSLYLLE
jgi:hypothetical protein